MYKLSPPVNEARTNCLTCALHRMAVHTGGIMARSSATFSAVILPGFHEDQLPAQAGAKNYQDQNYFAMPQHVSKHTDCLPVHHSGEGEKTQMQNTAPLHKFL